MNWYPNTRCPSIDWNKVEGVTADELKMLSYRIRSEKTAAFVKQFNESLAGSVSYRKLTKELPRFLDSLDNSHDGIAELTWTVDATLGHLGSAMCQVSWTERFSRQLLAEPLELWFPLATSIIAPKLAAIATNPDDTASVFRCVGTLWCPSHFVENAIIGYAHTGGST